MVRLRGVGAAGPVPPLTENVLAEKVFQQDVEVEVSGTDRYDQTLGRIWLGNADAQIRQESEVHCYRGDQPHVSARGSEEAWI
jgi:hypothetical protein